MIQILICLQVAVLPSGERSFSIKLFAPLIGTYTIGLYAGEQDVHLDIAISYQRTSSYWLLLLLLFTLIFIADECSGIMTLTSSSGTFTDGSEGGKYPIKTSCSWNIILPQNTTTITLNFTRFNLSSSDSVRPALSY